MQISLLLVVLLSALLEAQTYKVAQKSCEVFNDLKHKKNSFNKHLNVGESYRVTREQNDHYYIYIPNITISNRWVEKSCFKQKERSETKSLETSVTKEPMIEKPKPNNFSKKPKSLLLALSWQNSFCETHRSRRECYRNSFNLQNDNRFVLHGLWPQPRENIYCNVSYDQKRYDKNHQWNNIAKIDITDKIRKEIQSVMPGIISNLHRHEWIKHGTCYGESAQRYFEDAITMTKSVNNSKLGKFFVQNSGKIVTLQQVRFKADESFGQGSGKRVELRCRQGMITELWFHLGYGDSNLTKAMQAGKKTRSRCQRGRIDRAGF